MIKQRKRTSGQPAQAHRVTTSKRARELESEARSPGAKVPRPPSLWRTETRHNPRGLTCHHYQLHGLTCDEFEALRARAGGRCEICTTPEAETGGKRLVIDHFQGAEIYHIRGLICDKCNAVMACLDEKKLWGVNRRWEALAKAYEANSWHMTPKLAARIEAERQRRRDYRAEAARLEAERAARRKAA